MGVICYKCGQLGHIQTSCPCLTTKVRTAAIRTDGTVDPFLDPQDEEVLPPDQEGEGENSEHQEPIDEHIETPQYQWDTEEEEETEDNTVTNRANMIRITLYENEHATTKIMAM